MGDDALFVLNGTTLAAIGGVLGCLAGGMSFVFRQLLQAKDSQIDDLRNDRDYWREQATGMLPLNEQALTLAERNQVARDRERDRARTK